MLLEQEPPPEDDIDYAGNWREILQYPDPHASVSEDEQVQRALNASGARQITLPNGETLYVTDDDVITGVEDGYPSIESKENWLADADVDKYYPNVEQRWNDEFWESPSPLYHATPKENVANILKHGLQARNQTRGLSNRAVGSAVFTTSESEETAQGSYGDTVFEIDMEAMAQLPDRPFVSQEPPILEAELREALARLMGFEDYYDEPSSDISPYTVIIYGEVPPQFLTVMED